MQNRERVFIIIDGSNFYHRMKEVVESNKSLTDFDYSRFAEWLVGARMIIKKKYYIGAIRAKQDDTKGQTLRRNQQRLFAKLKNNRWEIEYGYILDSGDGYHEKGVDVHMSVDLLIGAYENFYDTVVLVSSDTDLIPALKKIRSMKRKVEYIGFSHKPSYGLITHSDIRRLLAKDDVHRFLVGEIEK